MSRYSALTRGSAGKMAAMTGRMVRTAEVSLSAFVVSAAAARLGPRGEVFGLPLPLAASLGLYAMAAFGTRGQYDDDLYNLADGTFAAYVAQQGAMVGAKKAVASGHWGDGAASGYAGDASGYAGQTDEDVEDILRAADLSV